MKIIINKKKDIDLELDGQEDLLLTKRSTAISIQDLRHCDICNWNLRVDCEKRKISVLLSVIRWLYTDSI